MVLPMEIQFLNCISQKITPRLQNVFVDYKMYSVPSPHKDFLLNNYRIISREKLRGGRGGFINPRLTLSFPILCAINFVAYKTALRRYVVSKGGDWNKIGRMPLPVRVNGDDIVFKVNMDFYENFWKPAVAAIGFTLSPGKNYIASKFLTVNSEAWRPLNNGRFEKIGYLNTGLVYSGPNGSMRPPLRLSHAEMPWTGKFDEALLRLHQQAP